MTDLTEDQILDIQTSDEPAKVIGKRLGISHQKVNAVRGLTASKPSVVEKVKKAVTPKVKGKKVSDGPTNGYRDGKDGKVEVCTFSDGVLPDGWYDTPADCENCDGRKHPDYIKVEL